jgi:peptidyl-prolyl cis-trans isomerase C
MVRRTLLIALVAAAAACSPQGKKKGPVVARGSGITITADDFKARLDEQSPFIRARYSTLDRKKEFLDNLVRFEVLAREAQKQGLQNDPDVQNTLKKIMVQKLVQKNFQDPAGAAAIPDEELQKYYDTHKDDYVRAKKVRVAAVVLNAPAGSPDRAKKLATARKALAKLKAEEKKNALAFAQIVTEFSEDAASKPMAGDLQFKTRAEFEKIYSKPLADAAFSLKAGETSGVVEAPQGFYILKYTGEQPELSRPFDQVKAQIASRLQREKKTKDFDEWLKKLKEKAGVTVDEKALDAIAVQASAPAGPMGGMNGMGGHGSMPPGAFGARPAPPLSVTPNAPPTNRAAPMVTVTPAPRPAAPAPTPRAVAPAPAPAPAK